jgi:hypothetical protein
LNAILYGIALTQAHHSPEARTYLTRRVAEGKTKRAVPMPRSCLSRPKTVTTVAS